MRLVEEFRKADSDRRIELASKILTEINRELSIFILGLIAPDFQGDVIRESEMAIFTSLKTFKGNTRKQFLAWCRTIVRRKASDMRRKQSLLEIDPLPVEDFLEFILIPGKESLVFPADMQLDVEYAMNLLGKSRPDCRELLWSHYVMGLDYEELAQELNLKYDGVRMRIMRCLRTARGLLGEDE